LGGRIRLLSLVDIFEPLSSEEIERLNGQLSDRKRLSIGWWQADRWIAAILTILIFIGGVLWILIYDYRLRKAYANKKGEAAGMTEEAGQEVSSEGVETGKSPWYHRPWVHFLLFLIPLGLGVFAGAYIDRFPWSVITVITGLVLGVIAGTIASKHWEDVKPLPSPPKSDADIVERFSVYTDGKMKRYTLLFAVNGGVFAIAQLQAGDSIQLPGMLSLSILAAGAVAFTALMTLDIWLWGQLMRRDEFAGSAVFSSVGKAILLSIGGLIISGWVLAALTPPS
jgi:hypothetical protein